MGTVCGGYHIGPVVLDKIIPEDTMILHRNTVQHRKISLVHLVFPDTV